MVMFQINFVDLKLHSPPTWVSCKFPCPCIFVAKLFFDIAKALGIALWAWIPNMLLSI